MNDCLDILEYRSILQAVADGCRSVSASKKVLSSRPYEDSETIRRELCRTEEAYLISYEYNDRFVSSFDPVRDDLLKVEKGGVLEPKALLRIERLLRQAEELQDAVMKYDHDERITELPRVAGMIEHAIDLRERLRRSVLSEDELADEASAKLGAIRSDIRRIQSAIKDKLRHYVTGQQYANILQDRIVTVRDGRYVLPVRAEYKSSLNGIVHDTSDSGATVYIEPMAIVEMNNRLREAAAEEQEEISRILAELSREVALRSDIVANNEFYYTMFDVVFARAAYAERVRGVRPQLSKCDRLYLKKARHPLLNSETVVPVDVENDKRILIISGPNTGGKTVVLKTVGLFCAMAYSGLFLPCEAATIPIFDAVYCDIGDNQSISESLSTFSSHIRTIKEILERITNNSLVLLDELGAGTDPIEGAALAVAVAKALVESGATAVVTTHYSEMKEFGLVTPEVTNASMEFDPTTLKPTYRVKMGLPGVSNALGIAAMLGMNDRVLEDARRYVGEGKRTFESVLAMADAARTEALNERDRLESERKQLETELEELRKEREAVREQYEKLTRMADREIEKRAGQFVGRAQEIVDRMTELEKSVNAENLLKAKQLKTSLSSLSAKPIERGDRYVPLQADRLKIGDEVILRNLGSTAKIKSLPDRQGRLDVFVGNMIMRVRLGDLAELKFVKPQTVQKATPSARHAAVYSGSGMSEVNLLGKTVDEAIPLIDALIDQALVHAISQIKIIHGNGTGALRKGILTHLKSHRHVKEFRQGAYGEGGYGVTIVSVR